MNARVVLSDDTSSAAAARRFVRDTLQSWAADEHTDTATLLISELVTNAVLHARCAPEVVLALEGAVLRVEVHDTSPVLPARRHYGLQAGTGRGMVLVEQMASEWGAWPTSDGKVVWFELTIGSGLSPAFAMDDATLADLAELGGWSDPAGADPPAKDPRGDDDTVMCLAAV